MASADTVRVSPTHVDLRALQEDEVDRIERSDDRQTRLDERMSPRTAADQDTREVLVIEQSVAQGREQSVLVEMGTLPSGVYLYRIQAGPHAATRSIVRLHR